MIILGKPIKRRQPHQAADRFYDYLMAHRTEVLRYIIAALVTGLIQFAIKRLLPGGETIAFAVRHLVLFAVLKYWAYNEGGSGFFYTARQLMIAFMIFVVLTLGVNYLTIFVAGLFGYPVLFNYIFQALYEIVCFLIYQFFIFKEQD